MKSWLQYLYFRSGLCESQLYYKKMIEILKNVEVELNIRILDIRNT